MVNIPLHPLKKSNMCISVLLPEALPLRYNERKHSHQPANVIRAGNQDKKKILKQNDLCLPMCTLHCTEILLLNLQHNCKNKLFCSCCELFVLYHAKQYKTQIDKDFIATCLLIACHACHLFAMQTGYRFCNVHINYSQFACLHIKYSKYLHMIYMLKSLQ